MGAWAAQHALEILVKWIKWRRYGRPNAEYCDNAQEADRNENDRATQEPAH
jgi:hypothetical protein